mmetsp:Transcript_17800/g.47425  ORF Transcript_17800/g.47425 Transcript_17800/m.47425 type:complete len:179 (+) Transcript_17800:741-1277(+)
MAATSSGCGMMLSSTTSGSREISPTATIHFAHAQPCALKPSSKDAVLMPEWYGTIAASAIWASPERIAAPINVPINARGIVLEGFLALEAMQQTSSKPIKPKNSEAVDLRTPVAPWGTNLSEDSNMLPVQQEKPPTVMNATKEILATVKALTTSLPMSMPPATTAVHNKVMPAAMGSK